jgi:hypothetical protein
VGEAPAGDRAFFGTDRVRRLLAAPRAAPRLRVHRSGLDWLAVSAEWEAEGQALTDADLAALRTATRRFVKLPSSGERVRRDASARAHGVGEAGQGRGCPPSSDRDNVCDLTEQLEVHRRVRVIVSRQRLTRWRCAAGALLLLRKKRG